MKRESIRELAEQVRGGDEAAARQLRLELQDRLEWLVRHVLRTGMQSSRLTKDIQRELDRLNGEALCSEQRDRLVSQVAGELCTSCIEQLRSGHLSGGVLETVVS